MHSLLSVELKELMSGVMGMIGQGIDYDGKGFNWPMQMLIAVSAVLAVAMFAIPAAMMAWGFEAEAERLYAKAKERERLKAEALGPERFFIHFWGCFEGWTVTHI